MAPTSNHSCTVNKPCTAVHKPQFCHPQTTAVWPTNHSCTVHKLHLYGPQTTPVWPTNHTCMAHKPHLYGPQTTPVWPTNHSCMAHKPQLYGPQTTAVCTTKHHTMLQTKIVTKPHSHSPYHSGKTPILTSPAHDLPSVFGGHL